MPCGRKSGRGDITSHDSYCCAAPYHSQTGSCRAAPNLNFSFAPFAQVSFVRKENHLRADKNFIPRRGMYICRRGMYICRRGLHIPRRGIEIPAATERLSRRNPPSIPLPLKNVKNNKGRKSIYILYYLCITMTSAWRGYHRGVTLYAEKAPQLPHKNYSTS